MSNELIISLLILVATMVIGILVWVPDDEFYRGEDADHEEYDR